MTLSIVLDLDPYKATQERILGLAFEVIFEVNLALGIQKVKSVILAFGVIRRIDSLLQAFPQTKSRVKIERWPANIGM